MWFNGLATLLFLLGFLSSFVSLSSAQENAVDIETGIAKAKVLMETGKYAEALTIYNGYLNASSIRWAEETEFGAGKCNYFLGKHDSAEKIFKGMKSYPTQYRDEVDFYLLDIEHRKLKKEDWDNEPKNKYRNLTAKLKKLVAETKKDFIKTGAKNLTVVCRNETGLKLIQQKRFKEAISEFEDALRESSDSDSSAYSQFLIGYTYDVKTGYEDPKYLEWNQKMAVEELGKVYEKYPWNKQVCPLALENLGYLLGCTGKKEEQRKTYELLLDKYPDSAYAENACFYLGQWHKGQGNVEKALDYYRKVLDNYSSSFYSKKAKELVDLCVKEIEEGKK